MRHVPAGFNAFIAVTFFTLAFVFHDAVMGVLNPHSESIRKIGAEYLSIVCFAYPIWAVSSVYAAILRSMGITKKPMIAAVIAMSLNILLDSVFVNGNFGFPKLGVPAAAASTIVGAALELTLLLIFTRRSNSALEARKADFIWPGRKTVRKMLKTAAPLTAKDMLWALGIAVYSISFASLGETSIAAYNVYSTMGEFMNVLFLSFGGAGGVLIGHVLGAGEIDTAKSYAWRLLRLVFLACNMDKSVADIRQLFRLYLNRLSKIPPDRLVEKRHEKFLGMRGL
jgi:Na+-driven multidrug efflux pump